MQGYNCVMVFNREGDRLLMCRRTKNPYKGLSNLVGGKIEPGEVGELAAYRELLEETGISCCDISLKHVMDFNYHFADCYVEVYAGRLNKKIELREEAHPLYWSELDLDFFDMEKYAGEGNIRHMLEQVKMYRNEIFD